MVAPRLKRTLRRVRCKASELQVAVPVTCQIGRGATVNRGCGHGGQLSWPAQLPHLEREPG